MTTTMSDTEAAVRRLNTDIARLRTEQVELLDANRRLIGWGITSASIEIRQRLRAIRCEVDVIVVRLHVLGADDDAYQAGDGWAVLPVAYDTTAVWS